MALNYGAIDLPQIGTPSRNPAAGRQLLYPKSDGKWYTKNGSVESIVGATTPIIAVGLRNTVDQGMVASTYLALNWNSVPYAQGDPSLSGSVLTFPTAGLYEISFNCFTSSATSRRQFRIETWTGTDPGVGLATTIAADDRYIGQYMTPTLITTHQMAANQKIRVSGWADTSQTIWNATIMPARLDVKSIT